MSVSTSKHIQHELQGSAAIQGQGSDVMGHTDSKRGRLTAMVLAVSLSLGLPALASAKNNPPPNVRADAPNTYIVKRGDTLWDISGKYLKDPWRWKEIWAVNRQVKNPHWIYPGDRLILCNIRGHRVVGVDQGDGCVGLERRMSGNLSDGERLSPRVHVDPLNVAVPAIPLSAIKAWLIDGNVVDANTLKKAPYVLAAQDRRVIAGAGDTVYIKGDLTIGNEYGVYRGGKPYFDPDTKELLGYESQHVATGVVTSSDNGVSALKITNSVQEEVRVDDKVLPEEVHADPGVFFPTNSEEVPAGRLVRVLDSLESASINSTIALNRGEREGVKVGQVFAIFRRGALVKDPHTGAAVQLPSERAGLAMVFRTFSKMSYAIVLEMNGTVKAGDEVRPPVATRD